MSAVMRAPAARAESTFAMTRAIFGQFNSPAAFRW
jgi:hypothetical protein